MNVIISVQPRELFSSRSGSWDVATWWGDVLQPGIPAGTFPSSPGTFPFSPPLCLSVGRCFTRPVAR